MASVCRHLPSVIKNKKLTNALRSSSTSKRSGRRPNQRTWRRRRQRAASNAAAMHLGSALALPRTRWLLLLLCTAVVANHAVKLQLRVGPSNHNNGGDGNMDASAAAAVPIDPGLLTSVTIDVCALKDGLNFSSSPLFRTLSANLAPAVLRIGGTDQNNYHYDLQSDAPCDVCGCGRACSMTRPYWDSVREFVAATGMRLIFGLSPDSLENAQELIAYTAKDHAFAAEGRLFAYSWGNERTGDQQFVDETARNLTVLRKFLLATYNDTSNTAAAAAAVLGGDSPAPPAAVRPLLVAPDTGVGPRKDTVPANVSHDEYISGHLQYLDSFVKGCGDSLDAVTWHTYDYRTSDIGAVDHEPLPYPTPPEFSTFFDPSYHGVVSYIHDKLAAIVRNRAARLSPHVWLSESNSVCHQGTFNVTNAFANSLWLLDRLGLMATAGVQLMARQSLIGFNYSLLGNFPTEPLTPSPDYFTTILFKRLVGSKFLPSLAAVRVPVNPESPPLRQFATRQQLVQDSLGGARVYGFCSSAGKGGVAVVVINLNGTWSASVDASALGDAAPQLYRLQPDDVGFPADASPQDRTTSRLLQLNGDVLRVDEAGGLPAFTPEAGTSSTLSVPPLTAVIAVFPAAGVSDCGD